MLEQHSISLESINYGICVNITKRASTTHTLCGYSNVYFQQFDNCLEVRNPVDITLNSIPVDYSFNVLVLGEPS